MRLRIAVSVVAILLAGFGIYRFVASHVSVSKKEKHERLDAVRSLPYAGWVPADASNGKAGVTVHNPERAYESLNFYNATLTPAAYLMDMEGHILHEWNLHHAERVGFQHALLRPDGDILAIGKESYLAQIGWDSSLRWRRAGRYHHEISTGENGTIYTLKRVDRVVAVGQEALPIIDDRIEILDSRGAPLSEISVYDLVGSHISDDAWRNVRQKSRQAKIRDLKLNAPYHGPKLGENSMFDVLHTNSVEPVQVRIPGKCELGDLLISVRNVNLVGCMEPKSKTLRWSWGPGILHGQHHAQILANGTIIIFDNRPREDVGSRAVIMDPKTEQVIWDTRKFSVSFYSASRGSAVRLPNENTLIVESDRGRVIEIDSAGTVVWEYLNPKMRIDKRTKKPMREAFYRFDRLHDPALKAKIEMLLAKDTSTPNK